MRLSTFIQDTLYEIALGVAIGRARSVEMVAVSPGEIDGLDVSEKTYIDFDVAVVVEERSETTKTKEGSGGAEIQVVSLVKLKAGAKLNSETANHSSKEQTHRITFKIPVYMNAHFRNNLKALTEAKKILDVHGIQNKEAKKEQA